ncbi:branched-chain alpha-keto acid dehydrogenase subunit E2 [Sporosarcina sp. P37]|uniref:dihydrolipoamide acetyltransferase family protein n=1 Tax=unclassified Sporosarcina TaxID=2647733 RepID=UPI000A17AEC0|nr:MULTISPECIES: dihydrolipoamide acetyltransferase family protein [unclassified Sporosarcina]ARK23495.1 branched-chain alpha-keto acid dehydrogenase subunit E2 [Sporosarcina sp. P37]PID17650.1 2-oxo acid dehydrogenase subunit E2 [Sporosarcina sp. P35]
MSETIVMPKLGMTMTEGTITEWYKEVGDSVTKGEPVLMISSEKLNQDVEAPCSGVLLEQLGDVEDELKVGEALAIIGEEDEKASAADKQDTNAVSVEVTEYEKPGSSAKQPSMNAKTEQTSRERIFITPLARRMAKDQAIDIETIKGSGGNGRITKRDIERVLASGSFKNTQQPKESLPPQTVSGTSIGEGLPPMRKAIARNMRESLAQSAQLTLHRKVDADQLIEFQQTLRNKVSASHPDIKLSITVLLARAAVLALQEVQSMNSKYHNGQLTVYNEVHLGIATSLDDGLLVPVIKNAQQKTIGTLADEMKKITEKARSGEAGSDLLSGSTFTITNLGASGIEYFTPILNPTETGILGIGSLQEELALTNEGTVTACKKIPLSITFDHQIVDGATAAEFLSALAKYIESPYLLVL